MDNNMTKEVFAKHKFGEDETHWLKTAVHIDWENLNDTFSQLLSDLLGRRVDAEAEREEYYYWLVRLYPDSHICQSELETLLTSADASELDREDNDIWDGGKVEYLSEGLCNRLMNKLLPFRVDCTRADAEGVWFIGAGDNTYD